MSQSERNGIFFQRLAVHVSTQPEVDWISSAETETNAAYLERCLLEAKKINSYLTYRREGACIGCAQTASGQKSTLVFVWLGLHLWTNLRLRAS